jgi:UDP-GlcNAc:undecaprenyl-phosphate GlcNAc-1-phosphate transferase
MGGIAIFCGFFISTLIWVELQSWSRIKFILVPLFVIFFIGVRDDLVPLKAFVKLIGQILALCLLILMSDLRIESFYGLFGIHELPLFVSYPLTIFTCIVITNSFNLIDGLDGLAATIATIGLVAFGWWFYLVDDRLFAIICFSMVGAILAFLIFNWEPSTIFMGDTGALVIGMTLAIISIHFIHINYHLPADHVYRFNASIATAACFIMIPLVDTGRIILLRLMKGQSPFRPDKSHIHHAIMRLGKTHGQTTLILGAAQLLFVVVAIACHHLSEMKLLAVVVGLSIVLSVSLDRLILKKL